MKFKKGDIVTLIDRGDFRAEVNYIPEGYYGHVQLKFFEDGYEHLAYSKVTDLSLVCRQADTTQIQLIALSNFATSIGYSLLPSYRFVHHDYFASKQYIYFNTMVKMYNDQIAGTRIIDKVKLQYSKKRQELITQSNWIKYN